MRQLAGLVLMVALVAACGSKKKVVAPEASMEPGCDDPSGCVNREPAEEPTADAPAADATPAPPLCDNPDGCV